MSDIFYSFYVADYVIFSYTCVVNYTFAIQLHFMKDDFVHSLGYVSLAVRLKRISESMIHSGRHLYKSLGIDIEPNWYLVFLLLKKEKQLSVTEIAERIHFSHPSVISMVKKMRAKSYLESETDAMDSRRQLLSLSEKALKLLPELEQIWKDGAHGMEKMFGPDQNFLDQLKDLENKLRAQNFMQRTLNELKNEQ